MCVGGCLSAGQEVAPIAFQRHILFQVWPLALTITFTAVTYFESRHRTMQMEQAHDQHTKCCWRLFYTRQGPLHVAGRPVLPERTALWVCSQQTLQFHAPLPVDYVLSILVTVCPRHTRHPTCGKQECVSLRRSDPAVGLLVVPGRIVLQCHRHYQLDPIVKGSWNALIKGSLLLIF